MNSVSWFIYFAQVSDSLGEMFAFLGILTMCCAALRFCIPRARNFMDDNRPGNSDYIVPEPFRKGWFVVAIAFLLASNVMPERKTLYAIAASEVGEQVMNTEIATDATKALHQWIKKQMEPETKK